MSERKRGKTRLHCRGAGALGIPTSAHYHHCVLPCWARRRGEDQYERDDSRRQGSKERASWRAKRRRWREETVGNEWTANTDNGLPLCRKTNQMYARNTDRTHSKLSPYSSPSQFFTMLSNCPLSWVKNANNSAALQCETHCEQGPTPSPLCI